MGVHAMWIVSDDLMGLRVDRGIAWHTRSWGLHQHARNTALRKAKTKHRAPLGRRHLHPKIVALTSVKGDAVIIRLSHFGTVPEWQFAAVRCRAQWACLRHYRHIAVVSHPDRWLVSADKAGDGAIVVVVRRDADPVLPCLRCPVSHAERRRHERHCAAISDRTFLTPNQWIDIGDLISISRIRNSREHTHDDNTESKPTHGGQYSDRPMHRQ